MTPPFAVALIEAILAMDARQLSDAAQACERARAIVRGELDLAKRSAMTRQLSVIEGRLIRLQTPGPVGGKQPKKAKQPKKYQPPPPPPRQVVTRAHVERTLRECRQMAAGDPLAAKRRLMALHAEIDDAANDELLLPLVKDQLAEADRRLAGIRLAAGDGEHLQRCSICKAWTRSIKLVVVRGGKACGACAEGRRCPRCWRPISPRLGCTCRSGVRRGGSWMISSGFETNRSRH